MSEDGGRRSEREVVYNLDRLLDAHTHLTEQESAEQIFECMDFCGIEKVFLFAPMLNVQVHEITSDSLDDSRTHNDYCADICSKAPDRLLGFCTLNPIPALAEGDLDRAVDLMVEEAGRCYYELGLRGAGR
jgi:predicted TIM-barrel fold metal-dependent hydrolase